MITHPVEPAPAEKQTFSLQSATYAEDILTTASKDHMTRRVMEAFSMTAPETPASAAPDPTDLCDLLNNFGTAPAAKSVVAVPTQPAMGDMEQIQNVQTLDSYISVLTALTMYKEHPAKYDLSDKVQAAQFVTDLANARNFVVTGGGVKAIPMYLSMHEATSSSLHKQTTTADLHLELLTAMFGTLGLSPKLVTELDGILTQVSESLKHLELSFSSQTQTLNHFATYYHLLPFEGSDPKVNLMQVEFIYIKMDQSSWQASTGKSKITNFVLDMTMTKTSATMNSAIVTAQTPAIIAALTKCTGMDDKEISKLTKLSGIQD